MENAPLWLVGLKCGLGNRRILRRFLIFVGATLAVARPCGYRRVREAAPYRRYGPRRAGSPGVPPLRRTTDLSEERREGQFPIPSGPSGHLPLIRGVVPPLRFSKNSTGIGEGRPLGLPPGYAPEALAEETQAHEWNRTSGNFCKLRAQWPGRNRKRPLRFCAPEIFHAFTEERPP